jgi:hypothetical protein
MEKFVSYINSFPNPPSFLHANDQSTSRGESAKNLGDLKINIYPHTHFPTHIYIQDIH